MHLVDKGRIRVKLGFLDGGLGWQRRGRARWKDGSNAAMEKRERTASVTYLS